MALPRLAPAGELGNEGEGCGKLGVAEHHLFPDGFGNPALGIRRQLRRFAGLADQTFRILGRFYWTLDNDDLSNEILDAVSASLGSADARKEQRTNHNQGEIYGQA
jgi:hypothetical protein